LVHELAYTAISRLVNPRYCRASTVLL